MGGKGGVGKGREAGAGSSSGSQRTVGLNQVLRRVRLLRGREAGDVETRLILSLSSHWVGSCEKQDDARQDELVQVELLIEAGPHHPKSIHGPHGARMLAKGELRLHRFSQRVHSIHILVLVAVKQRNALVDEAKRQRLVEALAQLRGAQFKISRAHSLARFLQKSRRFRIQPRRLGLCEIVFAGAHLPGG